MTPNLKDAPLAIQIAFWVFGLAFTGLGSLAVWLLKEYLSNLKTFQTNIETKVSKQGSDQKELLEKVNGALTDVHTHAASIKSANLDFQQQVNREILTIHKNVTDVNANLQSAVGKAKDLDLEFQKVSAKTSQLFTYVESHAKSIENISKVVRHHNQKIVAQDEQIKTIITDMGKYIIIGSEKKDPKKS